MAYISKSCLTCRHCVVRGLSTWTRTQSLTDKYDHTFEVLTVVAPVTSNVCLHHGIYLPLKTHEYVCDDWEDFEKGPSDILRKVEE